MGSLVTPQFPLRFTDEDGAVLDLPSVRAIEDNVEYCDDYQASYVCIDEDARRVRLIVWDLQLLVCQCVPQDYDPAGLYVVKGPNGQARQGHIEMYQGTALRAIIEEEATLSVSVEPTRWESGAPNYPDWREGNGSRTEGQVRAFHDRWMRARLGGRFP